jgi:hypothetical protein
MAVSSLGLAQSILINRPITIRTTIEQSQPKMKRMISSRGLQRAFADSIASSLGALSTNCFFLLLILD